MLSFGSASNGIIDTGDAIQSAIRDASGNHAPSDALMVALHLTMGHDDQAVIPAIRALCPDARIVGCTCAGVIGREGANESMRAVAVMLVWGDASEVAVTTTDNLVGANSTEAAAALADEMLAAQGAPPQFSMFLGSGIDVDADGCIHGIESKFGADRVVFGGTSADNMKGLASFQFLDDEVLEHGAVLVGFYDPTLEVYTQASHGFVPSGATMTVTRSTGNAVHELDGEAAWSVFTRNLGLSDAAVPGDTIPPGAVGVELTPELAEEYGDSHLLRVITRKLPDGTFLMPVACPVGTTLALMLRDEERIFRNMDVMMDQVRSAIGDRSVVAVFHADCGARGRLMLDGVSKTEIVERMQAPLRQEGHTPPWLGMYGFGEFAILGGENRFHNYTTSLYVITRP
jgi:hypothetical protein